MQVRLIVPDCNRSTSPLVAYGKTIADIAGGFTATSAVGGWIDNQGQLIVEPVTVFDCNIDTNQMTVPVAVPVYCEFVWEKFTDLAKRIARELRQDCVYLAIDGRVELVKA